MTGNEQNTSITTTTSQLSNNQDTPAVPTVVTSEITSSELSAKSEIKLISAQDYADHMQLALNQLETVTLMLQVLEQADGGSSPTE